MKLVFNTQHGWYINSNETSQTQEQITQLILVCLGFIMYVTEQEEGCLIAYVMEGESKGTIEYLTIYRERAEQVGFFLCQMERRQ